MSETVHSFTTTVPRWQPYVIPVDLATATDEQREEPCESRHRTRVYRPMS